MDPSDDEEEIQQLRLAKARAEREELEAKLQLAEIRRRKRLAQKSSSSSSSSSSADAVLAPATPPPRKRAAAAVSKQDDELLVQETPRSLPSSSPQQQQLDIIAATPTPPSRRQDRDNRPLQLSPSERKLLSAEIIKRRKLSAYSPAIASSILRARTSLSHTDDPSPEEEIQVPKSPSPVKARVLLGLDVGRNALDVSLSRARGKDMTARSIKHGIERAMVEDAAAKKKIQAPTVGLRSTRETRELKRGSVVRSGGGDEAARRKGGEEEGGRKTSFADNFLRIRKMQREGRSEPLKETVSVSSSTRDQKHPQPPPEPSSDSESDLDIEPPIPADPPFPSSTPPLSSSDTTLPTSAPPTTTDADDDDDLYDPHANLYLTTRHTPAAAVARALADKTVVSVSGLCKQISPPDYDPPAWADWAVLGVVARKSGMMYMRKPQFVVDREREREKSESEKMGKVDEARIIRDAANAKAGIDETFRQYHARVRRQRTKEELKRQQNGPDADDDHERAEQDRKRRRYFIVTLTDLRVEIDLFVCGPQVEKLWKLRVGDLIAVYNPGVWAPKQQSQQQQQRGFRINLDQPDDEVLELGRARDFGLCKALTKKQQPCANWVCTSRTEYCEFHIELAAKRNTSRRADLNKGTPYFAPRMADGRSSVLVRMPDGKQVLVPADGQGGRKKRGGGAFAGFKGEVEELGYELPQKKYRRGGL